MITARPELVEAITSLLICLGVIFILIIAKRVRQKKLDSASKARQNVPPPFSRHQPRNWEEYFNQSNKLMGFPPEKSAAELEDERRQAWFTARLWHNGPHAACCPKCMQAGYVLALVRCDQLHLLGEHPELITVYEELVRDGMINKWKQCWQTSPASNRA